MRCLIIRKGVFVRYFICQQFFFVTLRERAHLFIFVGYQMQSFAFGKQSFIYGAKNLLNKS